MKKNILINISLFILCFFCFLNSGNALNVSGLGDGDVSPGTTDYCNDKQGCIHNEKGVRITLVDKDGVIISGTNMVDYWNNLPSGSPETVTGSTFKSQYINSYGNIIFGFGGSYSNYNQYTSTSDIGGINWQNQHENIENIIKKIDSDACVNPSLFSNMGYDICEKLKQEDCKENLMETYILIEPLFHINILKHDVVVTGTEFTFLVDKQRQIDSNRVYNLSGDAGYGSAFAGMYITKLNSDDKTNYAFNANGKKYRRLTETRALRYSSYDSWVHQAAYGAEVAHYPLGNSMHLVWLGDSADEVCEPENCCIPCDENPKTCKEKYGENYNSNDPTCCYADTIMITKNGKEVCEPANEYWKDKNKSLVCCIPTESNRWCCDTPGFCDLNPKLCEEKCSPSKEICPPNNVTPEFVLGVCTDDNSETMSYFRDGVFNSKNGLLKNYNTYEELTAIGGFLNIDETTGKTIIDEKIVNMIAITDGDNTFQAVAKSNDSRYVTKINDYCSITCQEIFDVTLPDNYPVVNAGRYFRWHIKDSEIDIAKASGAKLCAVDIDLDKAIDEYLHYSQAAKMAAMNMEKFRCDKDSTSKVGVGGALTGAYYNDFNNYCEGFYKDYVSGDLCNDPVKDGYSYPTTMTAVGECCSDKGCTTKYRYDDLVFGEEARKKVYNGEIIYDAPTHMPFETCVSIPLLKDESMMYERPGLEVGDVINPSTYSPKGWCDATYSDYDHYLAGYSTNVEAIYLGIRNCYYTGKNLAQNYNIDMDVELNYQTLFNSYTYSTEGNNDENKIVKYNESKDFFENRKCIESTTECKEDLDENGWIDTPFYMDYTIRKFHNNKYYGSPSDSLRCGSGNWDVIPSIGSMPKEFRNPNKVLNPNYPTEMLNIWLYIMDKTNDYDNVKKEGTYEEKKRFIFTDEETGESYWNTIYLGLVTKENYYKLDDAINACICKDGYVTNLVNGECVCEREVSYYDFTSQYSNYQKLDDGTLTVEFMNGSGLYPISLKYWTLGNVLNGIGHFDSIVTNSEYSATGKICENGICTYGDPDGVCRYVIKNRIIAHPDDNADCDDGPCEPCDYGDDSCEPEPKITCIDDNGDINKECRELAGLNVIYRVVDLNDPFPEERSPGTNWIGNESIITENRGVNGMQLYSSSEIEPLYSFELTPAVIKEIRRDSASLDSSTKYTVGSVVYGNGQTTGGYSLFIHQTLSKYGIINIENDSRFSSILETGSTID